MARKNSKTHTPPDHKRISEAEAAEKMWRLFEPTARREVEAAFYSRYMFSSAGQLAALAEGGDDDALLCLFNNAYQATHFLNEFARKFPNRTRVIARDKSHWPLLCGPSDDKARHQMNSAHLQLIELAADIGRLDFESRREDNQSQWVRPVVKFIDDVRWWYCESLNRNFYEGPDKDNPETVERVRLIGAVNAAAFTCGKLPFNIGPVEEFDLQLAKSFAILKPLTKATLRQWMKVITKLITAYVSQVDEIPVFQKTVEARNKTKGHSKGSSSWVSHGRDGVFKRIREILERDAPCDSNVP